jgi:ferredoxin-NADP reductase
VSSATTVTESGAGEVPRRRLGWHVATLVEARRENATARTLVLHVPGWPGHLAGQHADVRLTAEDGYHAQRSYSIASAPDHERVELTVQMVDDGEVSPYLVDDFAPGAAIELRGPVGGWFVWRATSTEPVLLVGGGSGVVPLMAMIRTRRASGNRAPFRLLYSVRSPEDVLYAQELRPAHDGVDVTIAYTRRAAEGVSRPAGRLSAADLSSWGWPADFAPQVFVCGPTGFVEAMADALVALGHDAQRIKTERFGPTGG